MGGDSLLRKVITDEEGKEVCSVITTSLHQSTNNLLENTKGDVNKVLSLNANKEKEMLSLLEILDKYASNIYSKKFQRLPSFFATNREYGNKLLREKSEDDMTITLDCYGEGCSFDHHSIDFLKGQDTEVATTLVSNFVTDTLDVNRKSEKKPVWISILGKLLEKSEAFQKQGLLDKKHKTKSKERKGLYRQYLNSYIPVTTGYLDTDAVLSHFSLLYPKVAERNKELLDNAAMHGDLNLPVNNKSVYLDYIITGLAKKYWK